MRKELIRPSGVRRMEVRCTVGDVLVESLAVPVVFFFERRLDSRALSRALEQALTHVPLFAARLATDKGALRIHCEGQGVPFTVASSERTLVDAIRSVTEDRGGWLVDMVEPRRARSGRSPLLTVRLTELADGGTALGCCWHHSVGDMHSFMLLMNAWVAAAAGEPILEPLTVEDRVAYLYKHLPPDGASVPGLRRLGFGELLRYAVYFAAEARRKRAFSIFFGEEELGRMRQAYGGSDARLSANDVICAHLAEAVSASDPKLEQRRLVIAVNYRKRCGLDASLMGNMVTSLSVDVAKTDPAANIAARIRRGVDRFADEHMDVRISQQFADELGPRALSRCLANAIDPLGRHPLVTNWSNFGVYGVRFDGMRPVYFTPITEFPVPWLNAIVEGFEGRGRLFVTALPTAVADAMQTPAMRERIHRFREAGDTLPELHDRVATLA